MIIQLVSFQFFSNIQNYKTTKLKTCLLTLEFQSFEGLSNTHQLSSHLNPSCVCQSFSSWDDFDDLFEPGFTTPGNQMRQLTADTPTIYTEVSDRARTFTDPGTNS
jgi:hypothetical protein